MAREARPVLYIALRDVRWAVHSVGKHFASVPHPGSIPENCVQPSKSSPGVDGFVVISCGHVE